MSRRRRRDPITWGPASMPDMRRSMVEMMGQAVGMAGALPGADDLRRGLEVATSADLYWVSSEMTELALDASTDLPAWTPLAEAPAPTGLVLYERDLPDHAPLDPLGQAWAAGSRAQARAQSTTITGLLWACVGGGMTVWPVMRDPKASPPAIISGVLGTTVPSTEPIEDYPPQWAGPMALLGATWVLMGQHKVASSTPREVVAGRDAAIRKRHGQGPARVQVIDLRPMRYVPTEEADPDTGRTYTHRWVVRGHWRQQPVGQGRTQRRPTWVHSYLKGPEGAPLLTGDRVYVWRR